MMRGLRISSAVKYRLLILLSIAIACPGRKKPEPVESFKICEAVVRKGETLEFILNNYLRSDQTYKILNVPAGSGFPFRRCLPGDSIVITMRENEFQKLNYRQNLLTQYQLVKVDSFYNVAMKLPYIDTVQC